MSNEIMDQSIGSDDDELRIIDEIRGGPEIWVTVFSKYL